MKKKVIFLVLTLVFCIGCFNFGKLFNSDVLEDKVNELDSVKHLSSLNTLSMMLETEAGSGEYTLETRSSWPTKDDGYVFNETLSKCENGSTLSWDEENNLIYLEGISKDKCYVYFDISLYHESCNDNSLACYIAKQYTGTQGDNSIYNHDLSLENGAGDNSYRFAGASEDVANYVCFGSNEETCPNDNLYRIIGVFNKRVKIIKYDFVTQTIFSSLTGTLLGDDADSYGACTQLNSSSSSSSSSSYKGNNTSICQYYWNKTNSTASFNETSYYNNWNYSELNKTNLNKNYIDNIGSKWAEVIDETLWKVGGNTDETIIKSNAPTAYLNEITNPSSQVLNTYTGKVGLMYVSDYYYGASPTYWTYKGYTGIMSGYSDSKDENWLYMGFNEWTITRSASDSSNVYVILSYGNISPRNAVENIYAARPTFYLKSSVEYSSGTGTKTDPIRIKLN